MKNLNKKIAVVVLSGMLLSGGGLAASSSVAHADIPFQLRLEAFKELDKGNAIDEILELSKGRKFQVFRSNFSEDISVLQRVMSRLSAKQFVDNIKSYKEPYHNRYYRYSKDIDSILGIGWFNVIDVKKDYSMSEFREIVKSGKLKDEFSKYGNIQKDLYRLKIGDVKVIIQVYE